MLSAQKNITLAIVALDEEVLIRSTIDSVLERAGSHFLDYEIILINDGSHDNTGTIMDSYALSHPKIKVLHHQNKMGLGTSFQDALKKARCEYFMMLCGDGGLPAESLPPIFNAIGKADIIIPNIKNLKEIKTPFRYLLSRTYTTLLNLFFQQKIPYYNGLPIYKTHLLKQINLISSGFGFQGEIITKLLKAGCSYHPVDVLGAEKANRSRAVSFINFLNVGKTFFNLIWELTFFNANSIKRIINSEQASNKVKATNTTLFDA